MSTSINKISPFDIHRLSPLQLSDLLLTVLLSESKEVGFTVEKLSVPFNITTPDGGEDGLLIKSQTIKNSRWVPSDYSFFQNKATNLSAANCVEEVLEKKERRKRGVAPKPRKLKPRVQTLVEKKGMYILFTTAVYVEAEKTKRIDSIRKGLRLGGCAGFATFPVEIYDANDIAQWANKFIGAVSTVQRFCNISRPNGFSIWDDWAKLKDIDKTVYQTDSILREHETNIEGSITDQKMIRIIGHSGLGKTRLVFEAFRNSLKKGDLVYYDHEGSSDIKEIQNYILSHQATQSGIIVVDNCSANNHLILQGVIMTTGLLNVITIGYDDSISIEKAKIRLERKNQFEIVEKIIAEKLGATHPPEDLRYLKNISEGYPWMAERFCMKVARAGLRDFSTELPEEFIIKLLFGGPKNNHDYEIIRACSVFSSFGFPDDYIKEILTKEKIEFLKAQVEYIRTRIHDGSVTYDKFYEICQKYKAEDIIERRGLYYIVKPNVLAINLAADWLLHTDSDKLKTILTELSGTELASKITERLTDLDQVTKASEIVESLWGPGRFFASAEVLNTSWGSLLFRNVVEVNSIATALGIQEAFGNYSIEQLKLIKEGRRNLVWALEKLAFKNETFSIAARLMLSFGAAENESWSNNASHQFAQLFQVFLSGTKANYDERLIILKWGLAKEDLEYARLCVNAMGRALNFRNAMRMGGAENQGSSAPLKDYYPESQEVMSNYWKNILEILVSLSSNEDEIGDLARSQIASATRQLISAGQTFLVCLSIKEIANKINFFWKDAYAELAKAIEYEKPKGENLKMIQDLMLGLKPNDFRNNLITNVIDPSWNSFETDEKGIFIDKQRLNAIKFGEYVYENKIDLVPYLEILLLGEQRQTFSFAKRLGELMGDHVRPLLDIAISKFRILEHSARSPELIGGLIAGARNEKLFEETIDLFIKDCDLNKYSFYLTRIYDITLNSLLKLFSVVETSQTSITAFKTFQYGRILDPLTNEELITLTDRIKEFGIEGKWTALNLLFMNSFAEPGKWAAIKEAMFNLIVQENLLLNNSSVDTMEAYYWESTVLSLLHDSERFDFAKKISMQIIEYCSQQEANYSIQSQLLKVIQSLFDKYFDTIWNFFGECLIGTFPGYYNLKNLLWVHDLSSNQKSEWIFDSEERSNSILEWVKQNGLVAAKRFASIMPLGINKGGEIVWHPFSRALIESFGNDLGVLNEVSANMGTFGSIGSTQDYFKLQKHLLEQLLDSGLLEVRDWAIKMIKYTDQSIKRAEIEDEGGQSL